MTSRADEAPQIAQCIASAIGHDVHRGARGREVRAHLQPCCRRLDHHHAHTVRNDVVQFARDPRTFLSDRACLRELVLVLQPVLLLAQPRP